MLKKTAARTKGKEAPVITLPIRKAMTPRGPKAPPPLHASSRRPHSEKEKMPRTKEDEMGKNTLALVPAATTDARKALTPGGLRALISRVWEAGRRRRDASPASSEDAEASEKERSEDLMSERKRLVSAVRRQAGPRFDALSRDKKTTVVAAIYHIHALRIDLNSYGRNVANVCVNRGAEKCCVGVADPACAAKALHLEEALRKVSTALGIVPLLEAPRSPAETIAAELKRVHLALDEAEAELIATRKWRRDFGQKAALVALAALFTAITVFYITVNATSTALENEPERAILREHPKLINDVGVMEARVLDLQRRSGSMGLGPAVTSEFKKARGELKKGASELADRLRSIKDSLDVVKATIKDRNRGFYGEGTVFDLWRHLPAFITPAGETFEAANKRVQMLRTSVEAGGDRAAHASSMLVPFEKKEQVGNLLEGLVGAIEFETPFVEDERERKVLQDWTVARSTLKGQLEGSHLLRSAGLEAALGGERATWRNVGEELTMSRSKGEWRRLLDACSTAKGSSTYARYITQALNVQGAEDEHPDAGSSMLALIPALSGPPPGLAESLHAGDATEAAKGIQGVVLRSVQLKDAAEEIRSGVGTSAQASVVEGWQRRLNEDTRTPLLGYFKKSAERLTREATLGGLSLESSIGTGDARNVVRDFTRRAQDAREAAQTLAEQKVQVDKQIDGVTTALPTPEELVSSLAVPVRKRLENHARSSLETLTEAKTRVRTVGSLGVSVDPAKAAVSFEKAYEELRTAEEAGRALTLMGDVEGGDLAQKAVEEARASIDKAAGTYVASLSQIEGGVATIKGKKRGGWIDAEWRHKKETGMVMDLKEAATYRASVAEGVRRMDQVLKAARENDGGEALRVAAAERREHFRGDLARAATFVNTQERHALDALKTLTEEGDTMFRSTASRDTAVERAKKAREMKELLDYSLLVEKERLRSGEAPVPTANANSLRDAAMRTQKLLQESSGDAYRVELESIEKANSLSSMKDLAIESRHLKNHPEIRNLFIKHGLFEANRVASGEYQYGPPLELGVGKDTERAAALRDFFVKGTDLRRRALSVFGELADRLDLEKSAKTDLEAALRSQEKGALAQASALARRALAGCQNESNEMAVAKSEMEKRGGGVTLKRAAEAARRASSRSGAAESAATMWAQVVADTSTIRDVLHKQDVRAPGAGGLGNDATVLKYSELAAVAQGASSSTIADNNALNRALRSNGDDLALSTKREEQGKEAMHRLRLVTMQAAADASQSTDELLKGVGSLGALSNAASFLHTSGFHQDAASWGYRGGRAPDKGENKAAMASHAAVDEFATAFETRAEKEMAASDWGALLREVGKQKSTLHDSGNRPILKRLEAALYNRGRADARGARRRSGSWSQAVGALTSTAASFLDMGDQAGAVGASCGSEARGRYTHDREEIATMTTATQKNGPFGALLEVFGNTPPQQVLLKELTDARGNIDETLGKCAPLMKASPKTGKLKESMRRIAELTAPPSAEGGAAGESAGTLKIQLGKDTDTLAKEMSNLRAAVKDLNSWYSSVDWLPQKLKAEVQDKISDADNAAATATEAWGQGIGLFDSFETASSANQKLARGGTQDGPWEAQIRMLKFTTGVRGDLDARTGVNAPEGSKLHAMRRLVVEEGATRVEEYSKKAHEEFGDRVRTHDALLRSFSPDELRGDVPTQRQAAEGLARHNDLVALRASVVAADKEATNYFPDRPTMPSDTDATLPRVKDPALLSQALDFTKEWSRLSQNAAAAAGGVQTQMQRARIIASTVLSAGLNTKEDENKLNVLSVQMKEFALRASEEAAMTTAQGRATGAVAGTQQYEKFAKAEQQLTHANQQYSAAVLFIDEMKDLLVTQKKVADEVRAGPKPLTTWHGDGQIPDVVAYVAALKAGVARIEGSTTAMASLSPPQSLVPAANEGTAAFLAKMDEDATAKLTSRRDMIEKASHSLGKEAERALDEIMQSASPGAAARTGSAGTVLQSAIDAEQKVMKQWVEADKFLGERARYVSAVWSRSSETSRKERLNDLIDPSVASALSCAGPLCEGSGAGPTLEAAAERSRIRQELGRQTQKAHALYTSLPESLKAVEAMPTGRLAAIEKLQDAWAKEGKLHPDAARSPQGVDEDQELLKQIERAMGLSATRTFDFPDFALQGKAVLEDYDRTAEAVKSVRAEPAAEFQDNMARAHDAFTIAGHAGHPALISAQVRNAHGNRVLEVAAAGVFSEAQIAKTSAEGWKTQIKEQLLSVYNAAFTRHPLSTEGPIEALRAAGSEREVAVQKFKKATERNSMIDGVVSGHAAAKRSLTREEKEAFKPLAAAPQFAEGDTAARVVTAVADLARTSAHTPTHAFEEYSKRAADAARRTASGAAEEMGKVASDGDAVLQKVAEIQSSHEAAVALVNGYSGLVAFYPDAVRVANYRTVEGMVGRVTKVKDDIAALSSLTEATENVGAALDAAEALRTPRSGAPRRELRGARDRVRLLLNANHDAASAISQFQNEGEAQLQSLWDKAKGGLEKSYTKAAEDLNGVMTTTKSMAAELAGESALRVSYKLDEAIGPRQNFEDARNAGCKFSLNVGNVATTQMAGIDAKFDEALAASHRADLAKEALEYIRPPSKRAQFSYSLPKTSDSANAAIAAGENSELLKETVNLRAEGLSIVAQIPAITAVINENGANVHALGQAVANWSKDGSARDSTGVNNKKKQATKSADALTKARQFLVGYGIGGNSKRYGTPDGVAFLGHLADKSTWYSPVQPVDFLVPSGIDTGLASGQAVLALGSVPNERKDISEENWVLFERDSHLFGPEVVKFTRVLAAEKAGVQPEDTMTPTEYARARGEIGATIDRVVDGILESSKQPAGWNEKKIEEIGDKDVPALRKLGQMYSKLRDTENGGETRNVGKADVAPPAGQPLANIKIMANLAKTTKFNDLEFTSAEKEGPGWLAWGMQGISAASTAVRGQAASGVHYVSSSFLSTPMWIKFPTAGDARAVKTYKIGLYEFLTDPLNAHAKLPATPDEYRNWLGSPEARALNTAAITQRAKYSDTVLSPWKVFQGFDAKDRKRVDAFYTGLGKLQSAAEAAEAKKREVEAAGT
jgi:hypothetical protein